MIFVECKIRMNCRWMKGKGDVVSLFVLIGYVKPKCHEKFEWGDKKLKSPKWDQFSLGGKIQFTVVKMHAIYSQLWLGMFYLTFDRFYTMIKPANLVPKLWHFHQYVSSDMSKGVTDWLLKCNISESKPLKIWSNP